MDSRFNIFGGWDATRFWDWEGGDGHGTNPISNSDNINSTAPELVSKNTNDTINIYKNCINKNEENIENIDWDKISLINIIYITSLSLLSSFAKSLYIYSGNGEIFIAQSSSIFSSINLYLISLIKLSSKYSWKYKLDFLYPPNGGSIETYFK